MNNKIKIIILFAFILFTLLVGDFALAGGIGDAFGSKLTDVAGSQGAGYETGANPDTMIGNIIKAAISFVGVVFLVLMIYGGYLWMTARGNEQQVEKAKNLISAAIIGLIIVILSYAISAYLISLVGTDTMQSLE